MNDPKRLAAVVGEMHGCQATHLRSEARHGAIPWRDNLGWRRRGVLDHGARRRRDGYAWNYKGDDGKLHHMAVLGVPPINSPVDAVRAAAVVEARKAGPT